VLLLAAACARTSQGPAPRTEFLVANADSTFWVTSDARGVRIRGVPITLARTEGRFAELYVTDDDRSYYDALFVGQRLYRRDLISGDSAQLLSDGEVAGMAERFAREHPNERRLLPDEDGAEHPRTSAMAELRLLAVHGPYASYEHLTDIDIRGGTSRHAAHGGVIDLRTGEERTVRDLFGAAEEARIVLAAETAWRSARDSLLAAPGTRADATRAAIEHFEFSAGSFSLASQDRVPQVRFRVPGSGGGAGGVTIPLTPQSVVEPPWWREVRDELPLGAPRMYRWPRTKFELVARADTSAGDRATLSMRDGEHEWPVGVVQGPVRRVFWLDAPVLSRETRQALTRAFDAASLYSEQTRIVQAPHVRARPLVVPAARRSFRQGPPRLRGLARGTQRTVTSARRGDREAATGAGR
jgi:hypothetical protein